MNKTETTVCITGGHVTPALAVLEAMRTLHPEWNVVWIGRSKATQKSEVISEEHRMVTALKIPFYAISAGRLLRRFSFPMILGLCLIPYGIVQSYRLLRSIRPDCVVSFGGYVAFAVAVAAYLLHIPVVTHEQTRRLGLSNRIISYFAKRIYISYKEAQREDLHAKIVLTGLPIRESLCNPPIVPRFVPPTGKPLLYIVGGATGSRDINNFIYGILPKLLEDWCIVHQAGRDWITEALQEADSLPTQLQSRYMPVSYLESLDHAWMLTHANCLLGRSGANTVAEVEMLGIPAVFIPLPWSASNEQLLNARSIEPNGHSIIIEQKNLSYDTVNHALQSLIGLKRKKKLLPKKSAASAIVEDIESHIISPTAV